MPKPRITSANIITPDMGAILERNTVTIAHASFNVRVTVEHAKSVAVVVDGQSRVEQFAPLWALGDDGGVPKFPAMKPGLHTVTLTPWSEPDGKGERGATVNILVTTRGGVAVVPPVVAPGKVATRPATVRVELVPDGVKLVDAAGKPTRAFVDLPIQY